MNGALNVKVRFDVKSPGQRSAFWNQEDNLLYVLHWDQNKRLGKKQVITNSYRLYPGYVQNKYEIPAYDLCELLFVASDHFNASLHGRTWPMKNGGLIGDAGAEDDFAFTSLLTNVINAAINASS